MAGENLGQERRLLNFSIFRWKSLDFDLLRAVPDETTVIHSYG